MSPLAASTRPLGAMLASAFATDDKLLLMAPEEDFATPELQRLHGAAAKRLFTGCGRRPKLLAPSALPVADMDAADIY